MVTPRRVAAAVLAGTLLLVLMATVAIGAAPGTSRRSGPRSERARIARLDARLESALAEEHLAEACTLADSMIVLRTRASGLAPVALAGAIDSLALRFFAVGNAEGWDAASRYFEQSLALRERVQGPAHLDVARTLSALAILDDYLGRFEQASVHARRSLDIRLRANGPHDPLVASSLRQLGMARFELSDYAEAETLLVSSLATYEALGGDHSERIADLLNNLGEVFRVQDRFDQAQAYFQRGVDVSRARLPEDAPLRVALMNNLAGLYKDLARYDEAEPITVESLRLREDSTEPDSMAIANGHLSLAEVQRLQGRFEDAEAHYARALEIARSVLGPEHPELAPFVNQAAVLYRELADYDRAVPLFRESITLAERALGPDHPVVAQGLNDYGRLLIENGSVAAAESALTRALSIRERRLGKDHPEAAMTRIHLAEAASRAPGGAAPAMRAELDQAIQVLDATHTFPEARLDGHALRAALRDRDGDTRGALVDLDRALAAIDSLRIRRGGGELSRASLLTKHLDLYHLSVRLRVAAGDVDGALEAHERGRARVLLDQFASAGLDFKAAIPPDELAPILERETRARRRLARVQRLLQDAQAEEDAAPGRAARVASFESSRDSAAWEVQRALETIRERHPLWRRTLTRNGRPARRQEIAAALGRREALLEYHVGREGSYVFLIERDGRPADVARLEIGDEDARRLHVAPGPLDAARLEAIVAGESAARGPRSGIAARLADAGRATGAATPNERRQLHDRLAALMHVLVPQPIWSRVRGMSHVVIVPDGALHLLPFEALVTREEGTRTYYWLDEGPALRYAASATSLIEIERRNRERAPVADASRSILSVSDPAFGPEGNRSRGTPWVPLPGTRRETAAVRAAFAPTDVDTLIGADATEPAVRTALPSHRLIHLATHGFVTERRGDVLGGLVFARTPGASGSTDDDGLFQLFEIYTTRLDADLVVLSACETARGPRVAGEGVFTLSRGFLAAGARRVVASLWPVNDASTADLMSELFQRLARARRTRAVDYTTLVRDTKRALRAQAQYEDPFCWAPFVLSGTW